ncbi:hypothetical protein OAK27_00225 [Acidimicrobiaceae bacterium]|nr:hypothetical protein [Acidimicrobiaceae bacterium]
MKPVRRRRRTNELDTVGQAGWLYTDLLLGLMIVFLGLVTFSVAAIVIDEGSSAGDQIAANVAGDADDFAGFRVTPSDGDTEVSEVGTIDDFTITLDIKPESDVVLTITTEHDDELKIRDPLLTFTPDNWEEPQEVIVEGVDDDELDGDQRSMIVFNIDSAEPDGDFSKVKSQSFDVVTVDDDVPPPTTTLPVGVEKCYFQIDLTSVPSNRDITEEDKNVLKEEFDLALKEKGIAGQSIGVLLTFADSPPNSRGSVRAQGFNEIVPPLVDEAQEAAARNFYTQSLDGDYGGYRLSLYLLTGAEFKVNFDANKDGQCDEFLDPEQEAILMDSYEWWGSGEDVDALLVILGRPSGGFYGETTRDMHIAMLERYELSLDNVPSPP